MQIGVGKNANIQMPIPKKEQKKAKAVEQEEHKVAPRKDIEHKEPEKVVSKGEIVDGPQQEVDLSVNTLIDTILDKVTRSEDDLDQKKI